MTNNHGPTKLGTDIKPKDEPMTDPSERKKFWRAIAALCFAMLSQSYFLIGVFPYAGFFAMKLIPSLSSNTAGSYAGIISSSYMIGRMLTSIAWGKIADTIGRKPVFYWTYLFSGVFSIWFGTSTNIYSAIFARFMMGFGNGLIVTVKTTVTELAKNDGTLETKGMGTVIAMWGWGYITCPVISGFLSDPIKQYPNLIFLENYKPFLTKYPFILPNLFSVILCIVGSFSIYYFVDETLPQQKRKPISSILYAARKKNQVSNRNHSQDEEILPIHDAKSKTQPNYTTSGEQFGDQDSVGNSNNIDITSTKSESDPSTVASIWAQRKTRHHIIAHVMLAYSSIIVDEAFPLFCIATNAGLNLNEAGIGKILSGAGILFIIGHFFLFTPIVDHFGPFSSLKLGCMFAAPVVILMPISMFLNRGQSQYDEGITLSANILLIAVIGCKNVSNNIATTSVTVGMSRSVSQNQRATMNGLATLGGSLAKAAGPICAGFLVSFFLGSDLFSPTWGGFFLFGCISAFGLSVLAYVSIVLKQYY